MSNKIDIYRLYKEEIRREDDIVFQRNSASLTFQGFLFAAMTFLLSNPWFDKPAIDVYPLRESVLQLLGVAGIIIGLVTAAGIMAATSSIKSVSEAYSKIKEADPEWPQLHGGDKEFMIGGAFAGTLHLTISGLWAAYLEQMARLVYHQSIPFTMAALLCFLAFLIKFPALIRRALGSSKLKAPERNDQHQEK